MKKSSGYRGLALELRRPVIAYWQLDATACATSSSTMSPTRCSFHDSVQYPKADRPIGAGRRRERAGGETLINIPGDPRNTTSAWSGCRPGRQQKLVIQHMNRLQDTLHVMIANAQTGRCGRHHRDGQRVIEQLTGCGS